MANVNPIETNPVDSKGAVTTRSVGSVGKFSSVYDSAGYASSLIGPVAYAASATYAPGSADIVGASVNAAAGYSGGGGYLTTPGAYSGGAANYYGGGGGTLGLNHVPGGGGNAPNDMLSMAQEQLAQSHANSISMLIIQDTSGQNNRLFTATSNLINARDTMLASIIRNVRGA